MTVVNNNNFIGFDGTPVTGRTPTQTIVMAESGHEMTPQLRGAVARAYKVFCDAVNVSAFPNGYHMQNRKFQDGSKVRMESRQGKHRVFVFPVPSGGAPPAVFYWLRCFLFSGEYKTEEEADAKKVIIDQRKTRRLSVFPPDTTSLVFRRHVSSDGVLEIWVQDDLARKKYAPSKASPLLKDENEDPPDNDGDHEYEVSVWIKGSEQDTHVPLPCELIDGAVGGFGNPLHGKITGTVLESAHGSIDVAAPIYPFTWLMRFDAVPAINELATMDWKNYAIIYDRDRFYYPPVGREIYFGNNKTLYRTNNGRAYVISLSLVNALQLTVTAKLATVDSDDSEATEIFNQTLSYTRYPDETGPTAPYHVGRINFSPNGARFCVNISRVIYDTTLHESAPDHRAGTCVAVFEGVISGGSTTEDQLICTVSLKSNYLPVFTNTTTTTPAYTETFVDYPIETVEVITDDAIWLIKRLTTQIVLRAGTEQVNTFTTVYAKEILGGFYSNANALLVFEKEAAVSYSNILENTFSKDTTPFIRTVTTHKPTAVTTVDIASYAGPKVATWTQTHSVTSAMKLIVNGVVEHQFSLAGSSVKATTVNDEFPPPTRNFSATIEVTGTYLINGVVQTIPYQFHESSTAHFYDSFYGSSDNTLNIAATPYPTPTNYGINLYNETLRASNNVIALPGDNAAVFDCDLSVRKIVTALGLRGGTVLYADAYTGESANGKDLLWVSWNPITDEIALGAGTSWV